MGKRSSYRARIGGGVNSKKGRTGKGGFAGVYGVKSLPDPCRIFIAGAGKNSEKWFEKFPENIFACSLVVVRNFFQNAGKKFSKNGTPR